MNKKLFLTLALAAGIFAISHMSELKSVATVADNDVEEEMVMSQNDGDMDEMVVSSNDGDEELVMSQNDDDMDGMVVSHNDDEDLTLACGDDFFGDEEVQAQLECEDEACLNLAMTDDDVNLEDFVA